MTGPTGRLVIGLEVHLQLRTRTKLFCRCPAEYGAEPNTHVCEVCLGLPGAMPVANRNAVALALRTAVALGCEVGEHSAFARKHYFYPDLPKGYQITQHAHPLARGGSLRVGEPGDTTRALALRSVHLEEDSARSLHLTGGGTRLDFNRAGIPLLEIVTEPQIRTPAEARSFLVALKRLLRYLEVSDCNMEEGSLRVDANISLRGPDGIPGVRTEIKNLNSFSGVERALRFEAERRMAEGDGAEGERETRGWDASRGVTRPLRGKEEITDYRYLPEPDLPPLRLGEAAVREARASLPESPAERAARLTAPHLLTPEMAERITSSRTLADRFEAVVGGGVAPRLAAGWLLGEERAMPAGMAPPVAELIVLLTALQEGTVTRAQARAAAEEMAREGTTASAAIAPRAAQRGDDAARLDALARGAVEGHAAEVARFRAGDRRLLHFFLGEAMRASGGAAEPAAMEAALLRLLEQRD